MGIVRTQGVITKETKFGETSKIITLITKDFGKISAIANNVRGAKSHLLSGLSLFTYSDIVLYEGKGKDSLFRINEINVIESFKGIRESIDKMAYASYFSEIINKAVNENNPENELLGLFLNSLYMLNSDLADFRILKTAYEIKIAQISGYAPSFSECGKCGLKEKLLYVDPSEGYVCCERCGLLLKKSFKINNTVRDLWSFILNNNLKQAISVTVDKEITDYLNKLTEEYLSLKFETEFKTLKFLKNVMAV